MRLNKAVKKFYDNEIEKSRSEDNLYNPLESQKHSRVNHKRFLILRKDEVTGKIGNLNSSSPNKADDILTVMSGSSKSRVI